MIEVNDGPLASNAQLYGYLLQTAETLTRLGHSEAAMKVRDAAAHATGLSTEFLGESRNALGEALRSAGSAMSSVDQDRLAAVIKQLDRALKR